MPHTSSPTAAVASVTNEAWTTSSHGQPAGQTLPLRAKTDSFRIKVRATLQNPSTSPTP